jgi:positive regulator of sigma E activity
LVGNDLRTMAEVLAVAGGRVELEACGGGQCANCPGGCNWGGFRGPRRLSLLKPAEAVLVPGDRVWIILSRASMLRGAGWAYGPPLVGFFVGAAVGNFAGGDGLALALAGTGLGLGWWLARRGSRHGWAEPRIELSVGRS